MSAKPFEGGEIENKPQHCSCFCLSEMSAAGISNQLSEDQSIGVDVGGPVMLVKK